MRHGFAAIPICNTPICWNLVAVPVWRGGPRYQSYLIVGTEDEAANLTDLRGGTHAFSDPDSNSGYLVTATDLHRLGEQVDSFFSRSIFTFGHRNVVRAVADGLVRSGSVDGYVWEALSVIEPELTSRTRVIARSEWLGFSSGLRAARQPRLGTGSGPSDCVDEPLRDRGRQSCAHITPTRRVPARDSRPVRRHRGPHGRSGALKHEVACPHPPLHQVAASCSGNDGFLWAQWPRNRYCGRWRRFRTHGFRNWRGCMSRGCRSPSGPWCCGMTSGRSTIRSTGPHRLVRGAEWS